MTVNGFNLFRQSDKVQPNEAKTSTSILTFNELRNATKRVDVPLPQNHNLIPISTMHQST
jgi:hypothetical protein